MKNLTCKKKRNILFICLLSISTLVFANSKKINPQIDSLINFSKQYIGCRYQSGACGPNTFDCSGFTKYVFSEFGYPLNRSSSDQVYNGLPVKERNAYKGDLIFFKGSDVHSSSVGHVGIIVSESGEEPILFIHASTSSGIRIDKLDDDYFNQRFISISRIIPDIESKKKIEKEKEKKEKILNEEKKDNNAEIREDYYVVKKGDTMYSLAKKNNCSVDDIKRLNNLPNNDLSIGKKLVFKENNIQKAVITVAPNETNNVIYYVVRKGETLYHISKVNDCTVDELKAWNGLSENTISIGQQLVIKK